MKYKVRYTEKAIKELKKLDSTVRNFILSWIDKNLNNCENPRLHGKALVDKRLGQWRYRIGDYRLICQIQDKEIIILILEVGHRRSIY